MHGLATMFKVLFEVKEIGGTSLATPIAAGIFMIISQYLGKDLGNVNPYLYALSLWTLFLSPSSNTRYFNISQGYPPEIQFSNSVSGVIVNGKPLVGKNMTVSSGTNYNISLVYDSINRNEACKLFLINNFWCLLSLKFIYGKQRKCVFLHQPSAVW